MAENDPPHAPDRPGRPPLMVADVGGTNARFALAERGRPGPPIRLLVADHPSFDHALDAARARMGVTEGPIELRIAAAGPVRGDAVVLTNAPWQLSEAALAAHPDVARVRIVNDFAAIAMAVPVLRPSELAPVGRVPAGAPARATRLVLGPGTGLGAALAVPGEDGRWLALPTEAGHAGLAPPADGAARAALEALARTLGPFVAAEDVLCGRGLAHLDALGTEVARREPAEIAAAAARGEPRAAQAVRLFQALLGAFAGDAALMCGAFGGVYVTGGVVASLEAAGLWDAALFRAGFEDKKGFAALLAEVPVLRITAPDPALIGLAAETTSTPGAKGV